MKLRYQSASPFCRKALAVIRHRRDDVRILDSVTSGERKDLLTTQPLLTTPRGAFATAASIVTELEAVRRVLIPEELEVAVGDLDRLLDLYLLEPALVLALEPGSRAAVAAVYTTLRTLDLLEDRLSDGRRFLFGDALTLADVTAVLGATDAGRHGTPVPDGVASYLRRASLVPALGQIIDEADAVTALLDAVDDLEQVRQAA